MGVLELLKEDEWDKRAPCPAATPKSVVDTVGIVTLRSSMLGREAGRDAMRWLLDWRTEAAIATKALPECGVQSLACYSRYARSQLSASPGLGQL